MYWLKLDFNSLKLHVLKLNSQVNVEDVNPFAHIVLTTIMIYFVFIEVDNYFCVRENQFLHIYIVHVAFS